MIGTGCLNPVDWFAVSLGRKKENSPAGQRPEESETRWHRFDRIGRRQSLMPKPAQLGLLTDP